MPFEFTNTASSQKTENSILTRYAAELEAIADLDREYYLNPAPSLAERSNYYRRQDELEQIRQRLYSELCGTHRGVQKVFRVSMTDHAIGKKLTSSPQCILRHDLNNYLGVLIGRCELLGELIPTDSVQRKHLTTMFEMARKMVSRLAGDACPRHESEPRPPTIAF